MGVSATKTRPPHYDFGTWGVSHSLGQIRAREANTTSFWMRETAPHVVERGPRARSIPNHPGYDPSRDRNYFDKPLPSQLFDLGGFHHSLGPQGSTQPLRLPSPAASRGAGSSASAAL